jgi:hypothetical protein
MVYAILNVFSHGNAFSTTSVATGSLAKFNSLTGDWWIYLVMSLTMEYIVVLIYCITGASMPREQRDSDVAMGEDKPV